MIAADAFSAAIIDRSTDGKGFAESMNILVVTNQTGVGVFILIVLGLIGLIASLVQIVLMVVRSGMLVILAGILPTTAAFTNTEMGRQWFQKAVGWTIAFILYKPAAAIVYSVAFLLMGNNSGKDALIGSITGFTLMIVALFALPALMRFVTPMVGAVASGGGAGAGAAVGAMATGAVSMGRSGSGRAMPPRPRRARKATSQAHLRRAATERLARREAAASRHPGLPVRAGPPAPQPRGQQAAGAGAGAAAGSAGAASGAAKAAGPAGMAVAAGAQAASRVSQAAQQTAQDSTGGGPQWQQLIPNTRNRPTATGASRALPGWATSARSAPALSWPGCCRASSASPSGACSRALAVLAVAGASALLLTVKDKHGQSVVDRFGTRMSFRLSRSSGTNLYRSGPLGVTEWGMYQLPGLAAKSTLYEFTDSYKRPFALLHVPATSHFTVIFSTEPDGASLVDPEQVDAWVANWGGWLAGLADEAGLDAAAVTVETAPDSGYRLRNEVMMNIDPNAPDFAKDDARRGRATPTRKVRPRSGPGCP